MRSIAVTNSTLHSTFMQFQQLLLSTLTGLLLGLGLLLRLGRK